ncbi:MAG: undecaprenyl-phosphate glucose phosphotransferase [Pseudomonadota bacterium]
MMIFRTPNFSLAIAIVDILSIISSGIIAYLAYFCFEQWPFPTRYNEALVLSVLLSLIIFPWFKVHAPSAPKLIGAWITVLAVMALIAFGFKVSDQISRVWIINWAVLGGVMLIVMRWLVYHLIYLLHKRGWHKKIVIVGAQQLGQTLLQNIKNSGPYSHVKVLAFFDDDKTLQNKSIENIPVNGNIYALPTFVEENKIDEVWVTSHGVKASDLDAILHNLCNKFITVRFVANIFSFRMINASIGNKYDLPVITLTESPMTQRLNGLIKAIEDRVIATMILLMISPLMLIIAIGVKLSSPGPILYRQERVGWNGQTFIMLKFRSMPENVESDSGPVWAKNGENRATRFGDFMRKTSLDELPQFWNVLRGEMSIVGPRPERPCFVEQFKDQIPNYMQKHLVKGGITGWAQINGWRGNTDLHQRIEYDIYYIENWSVWFDIKIIFMTIFHVFFDKNAY